MLLAVLHLTLQALRLTVPCSS